ncbi:amino acid transporter-like protein [Amylocarpus encephaloides]|uniref:Amino acid transporter-like protein n=1 Tax=Amylocarpus encephaloides TaxID=45428 RepID=A0A9P7Y879_9HELO|nr:amino acid transporter-like protein [Amylocarpus encephaloides]
MDGKIVLQDSQLELDDRNHAHVEDQVNGDQDNVHLTRTGKRPVLKRSFGWISILGFSCIIMGTWEGSFITFGIGLVNGGYAGLIYGFIIVWFGTLATFTSLAELVSMAPTSGGQYHWVSILAPTSWQKFASYVTGWLTVAGWQAAVSSSSYIMGTILQGLIQLCAPSYVPELWHGTLLFYAVLLVCIGFNALGTALPKVESIMLFIFIIGFFATMIPMVWLAPHESAKVVFTTWINDGGWNSQGTSFFVGLAGNAFAFLGADSAYHMSEEIHNAATVVPRAIILSIFINGIVGLAALIAILFCLGDVEELFLTSFAYPFIQVFWNATNSVAGAAVMVVIVWVTGAGLAIGTMAAASRMLWAFARDRGVPGWRHISKVNARSSIPVIAIACTTQFSLLIGLISIKSPTAFNGVISLTLASLYGSYLIACALLLWRRLTGSIRVVSDNDTTVANLPGSGGHLAWGPFRIPGITGTAINAISVVYLTIVFIFTFFPTTVPTTAETMNYSSLVFGAVALLSGVYYAFWARKTYTGPVIEVDVSGVSTPPVK